MSVYVCVCECVLSCVLLFVTTWTVAHQAPLSHRVIQARTLEWVIIFSSRGSFWPRQWTRVSLIFCFAGGFFGVPCGSAGKESTCNAEDLGLVPRLGRSPGEGKGYLLQYSGLVNSMDCIIHGVTKSWTGLNDFHFHFLQTSDAQSTHSWTLLAKPKHLCVVVVC